MGFKRCSVRGCKVEEGQFFYFPRTLVRAEIWRKICANPKLDAVPVERLYTRFFVCKKHFAKNQFTNELLNKLLMNALPTLFLPSSESEDVSDYVMEVDVMLPSVTTKAAVCIRGYALASDLEKYSDQMIPPTVNTESLVVGTDSDSCSDQTLPPVDTVNTKDLPVFVDMVGGTDSESCSDQALPPVDTVNTKDLPVSVDLVVGTDSKSCLDQTLPPVDTVNTKDSSVFVDLAVVTDSENCSDQALPLADAENSKDLALFVDTENHSSQIPHLSVSENCPDYSNQEDGDFGEVASPMSPDVVSVAEVSPNNQESETHVLESALTEAAIPPLNDYYRYTLCRLCFCRSDSLVNIFEERRGCKYMISDALEDLLQFKVSKADDFPQFICSNCLVKLDEFKDFKDKLCKIKETFEKALQNLRKSRCEDRDEIDVDGGQSDYSEVRYMGNSSDGDCVKNLSEVEEMADKCLPGQSENSSLAGDAFTDSEGSDREDFDVLDTGNEMAEVKEIVHQEEYKCLECGQIFKFKNLLKMHYQEHRKEFPYACEYCDKRFKSLMVLNGHIVIHSNYKPFECELCGLRCRSKINLARHKMVHSGDKPFLCSICGFSFREKVPLQEHMRTHYGINCYKCTDCGAEFSTNTLLKRHRFRHQKGKPYVCGDCGKAFKDAGRLKSHVTCMHQKEKRFQCGICSKLFSLRRYLNSHMKIHNRNKT